MLRRFKDAVKFNFTVSPDDITLECSSKWEPHMLAVTCTRRSKKRSTKPISWERSTENPAKLSVRWSIPENLEMCVTFYRDSDRTHFDDKEWNFILEEIDGSKRKPLASETINLASLASIAQVDQKSMELKLRPISSKIKSADLALTLSWVFVKAGNSKDDDMQSVASFDALSNCSYDDSSFHGGSLRRNHHGGSDAGHFERLTPGRATITGFETGRRFANLFKSHRNKEKSPSKSTKHGSLSNTLVVDGTRTLPTPAHANKLLSETVQEANRDADNVSSEGTNVTSISVTASVHSDLTGGEHVSSSANASFHDGTSLLQASSSPSQVIKRSALPSELLKNMKKRQEEMMANSTVRPVYEGTPPPSSPEVEDKELLPPPTEIAPSSSYSFDATINKTDSSTLNVSSNSKNGAESTIDNQSQESSPLKAIRTTNNNVTLSNSPSKTNSELAINDENKESESQPANSSENVDQNPQTAQGGTNLQSLDLLDWCKEVTSGYPGVCITNLTTSWRNGLAFAATIHKFRPDLIDWDELIHSQSQSQLVYKRVLDAVLQLNVTSLPWEHGAAIDLNAVPDRLLVTKFLYELRQKLSRGDDDPENERPEVFEPLDFEPLRMPDPIMSSSQESQSSQSSSRLNAVGSKHSNGISPSNSMDRARVVSPVIGAPPRPTPGTPLMTRNQYVNPLDSDEEVDSHLRSLFQKPPPVPNRNPATQPPSQPVQPSPSKTPQIQRAASSPKSKIRVIKPNASGAGNSQSVVSVAVVPEGSVVGCASVSSSNDSSTTSNSLILPKVEEQPVDEVRAATAPRSPKNKARQTASPKIIVANSESNLVIIRNNNNAPKSPKVKEKTRSNSTVNSSSPAAVAAASSVTNSLPSSGSASRLKDILSSRPVLNFPEEIEHVPLPDPPPPSASQSNGTSEVANGTSAAKPILRSGVSLLIDVEPGEQEQLARKEAAIEKETADIQNLLQRMAMTGDRDMEQTLLQRLFVLVNRKDAVVRRKFQVDLVEKEKQLMVQRDEIEQQLRQLLAKEGTRTPADQVLEAELMNRLRAVVLERESVVEQLDLQTAEIERDEEMSSMNQVIRNGSHYEDAENHRNNRFDHHVVATISSPQQNLQAPVTASVTASPRLGLKTRAQALWRGLTGSTS